MKKNFLFTSESVSEGHPDKVCDRISDMVVDTYLGMEPQARVACETLTTTNKVVLAGETRGPEIKKDELVSKVRDCIKDIGYDQEGFSWKDTTMIETHLHSQSADIAMGVDSSGNKDEGAGDQGIMFGYACNETDVLMPAPIYYSHRILRLMAEDRKSGNLKGIEPDSKSQITIEYKDGLPSAVKSVVISTQHSKDVNLAKVKELCLPYIERSIPKNLLGNLDEKEIYINPTGNFVIGGPDGDSGLTGRKIIVDTYGGAAPHGGGAFSGKDPTKVDRSAAYASRYLAKNIVASKISDKCLIQLAYAIGVSKPLSIYVDLFDNDEEKNRHVESLINENFDLSPRGIREMLGLNKPIYQKTAAYGHFGRDPESDGSFSWEKTDKSSIFTK
ncbi:MAG: methionine adenosyltransferase [Candidatus Pelagibacter sp.]|nr:methionine adenosyltransferase [Candidatus Pelagibacter sp.]|tara:strand:+ start:11304 stop:12467 length:1164 start_codon:yes stop_codon:yes gene_type:complete